VIGAKRAIIREATPYTKISLSLDAAKRTTPSRVDNTQRTSTVKTKKSKQSKQRKPCIQLKDIKPKKDAEGGRSDSYHGPGVYKSTDSGLTW
jgi:hypothetical protein